MNFIAILIALGVETFYKPISQWRNYQWFGHYEQWMYNKLEGFSFRDSPISVILIFGLVFILTAVFATALYDFLGLLGFLAATFILIYSLGPDDLDDDVHAYLHALEHDKEGASHHAEKIIGYAVSGEPLTVSIKVKDAIFTQASCRMLAVLFWFVILGPAGALLYRLSDVQNRVYRNQQTEYARANQRLYYILSWLPARLSVLGYAVVGNFIDTMSQWQSVADFWKEDNDTLMSISGAGALQQEGHKVQEDEGAVDTSDIVEALALVKRGMIFWIAVLAVLTLTGTFF